MLQADTLIRIMELSAFRKAFDPGLEGAAREHIHEFTEKAQDPLLAQAVTHLSALVHGGKRLRPYLASLGYAAGGGRDETALFQLGTALELFHVFCLIHDDIIDKATTRRNVPTIEAFVAAQLVTQQRRGDGAHLAKSHAILLGDLVFSWASRYASTAALLSPLPRCVLDEYHGMVDEVVVGQMIDVDTMTRDEHDERLLERKMYLKTAGYSFVRPLRLGLCLSGAATDALLADMTAIGTPIGIAFQLQDDVLDITSDADTLGKPVLSDIRDGQQTILTAFVAQHGTMEEQRLLTRVMQGNGTDDDVLALRDVMANNGALAHAETRITTLWEEGRNAINEAQVPAALRETLRTLITTLQSRVR